jgi:hypothetical protein
MGIMVGCGQAGVISAAVNISILLLFSNLWKNNIKKYLLFFLFFLSLSSIFPVWNYINTGNFAPTNIFLNNLFNIRVNPDISNQYINDRMSLQFIGMKQFSFFDFLFFPFNSVFYHFNIFVFFFFTGLIFLKDKKLQILYFYYFFSTVIYLILVKNSFPGNVNERFHWVVWPVVIIIITYVMSKFSLWIASLFNNYGTSKKIEKNKSGLIVNIVYISLLVIYILSSYKLAEKLIINDLTKFKIPFITKNINLKQFLGENKISKIEYLNKNFDKKDRILYMFHTQGIYSKPLLYQPTISPTSIVYRTNNQLIIMNKLKKLGINYFCLDNKWGLGNDPFLSMVADITTPIFEPDFFAKHFIPISTNIRNFYVFKINYDGIKDIESLRSNCLRILQTGFFDLIYGAISRDIHIITKIPSNPYPIESLLERYKDKSGICLSYLHSH